MEKSAKIYVAGHGGLVGSALMRKLAQEGYSNVVTRTHEELDLTNQAAVTEFFARERPAYVFLAAARVGGILGNARAPAVFIRDNLAIQTNVIHAAHEAGVTKLLFLGSSCIYPKLAPQPITEDALLSGPLEPTNKAYAVAKIAGIEMCQAYRAQYGSDFIAVMPTNLYGPHDNFDLETSHVLPGLMARFHAAKVSGAPEVVAWGTGTPRREFLHVDDLARACLFLMDCYSSEEIINIGTGEDITIRELTERVAQTMGYTGRIVWDRTKPDGTPRKVLDVGKLTSLGFTPRIGLTEGLADTYAWYVANT